MTQDENQELEARITQLRNEIMEWREAHPDRVQTDDADIEVFLRGGQEIAAGGPRRVDLRLRQIAVALRLYGAYELSDSIGRIGLEFMEEYDD